MQHNTRRSLRVILSVIHGGFQLVIAIYVFNLFQVELSASTDEILRLNNFVMIHFAAAFGLFAAYYSFMKLLSSRNLN